MADRGVEDDREIIPARGVRRRNRALTLVASALLVYLAVAYLVLPRIWRRVEGPDHPALDDLPRHARTRDDIPGDPLNLAIVGTEAALARAMIGAGWHAADAITFRSSLRIAESTVIRRPDESAPVSHLYVWGKTQDLAFEQPVGHDARRRHHVRFWRSERLDAEGRPLWVGAATYDERVGLSHTTGQVTHHIGPDVDAERDKLLDDLGKAHAVAGLSWIDGFQSKHEGRNGGGDPYHTDGRLPVVVLGGD